jgi:hypothetical protein
LKPEIRNSRWRRQTGNTCISPSRQDGKEIPTVICMFSVSRNSVVLSKTIDVETGSEDFKMAAAKTGYTCISASMQGNEEMPKANFRFSRSDNSVALIVMHYLETGSEIQDGIAKPDVPVFKILCKTAKKFQLLSACFWGWRTQWRYWLCFVLKPEVRNSRWWLPNRKYMYLSFNTR